MPTPIVGRRTETSSVGEFKADFLLHRTPPVFLCSTVQSAIDGDSRNARKQMLSNTDVQHRVAFWELAFLCQLNYLSCIKEEERRKCVLCLMMIHVSRLSYIIMSSFLLLKTRLLCLFFIAK